MPRKNQRFIVTGDYSMDKYIYLDGIGDETPDLRETWLAASQVWTETLGAGVASVIQTLLAFGYDPFDPFDIPEAVSKSLYILTRQGLDPNRKWRIGRAIVSARRNLTGCSTVSTLRDNCPTNIPAIFIDLNQSDLRNNIEHIQALFDSRPYMVRTHDPRKPEWSSLRKNGLHRGIWFSSLQEMSGGALSFAGNWENVYDRLMKYLKTDSTLWDDGKWKHWLVIRIHSDGVLAVGPTKEGEEGILLIFAGDQPGSFLREGHGAVIGGCAVFTAALASALYDIGLLKECLRNGLSMVRSLTEEGYVGPPQGFANWKLQGSTNLPIAALQRSGVSRNILEYNRRSPQANWDSVCRIVCGTSEEIRTVTVLNMGSLATCCPDHAQTLLRFESRLKNHVNDGKGILSFTIFGGPGSGKSFVAEELAKAVDPGGNLFQSRIFNISQFGEPSRLLDSLQSIQAIGLQGKIPFVMWDEFDTTYRGAQAGWLPYFLMPMQDAKFFDGSYDIALGKCIFVFIGGTFSGEAEFREWAMNSKEGKHLKGIDFHSRLDSSLTVPSVDIEVSDSEAWVDNSPAKLVRALMLRNFLKKQDKLEAINPDLLAYLIHVPLQHGVRSLQRIITASELNSAPVFETYHLPPTDVLQIHVRGLNPNCVDPVTDFVEKLTGYDVPRNAAPLGLKWKK